MATAINKKKKVGSCCDPVRFRARELGDAATAQDTLDSKTRHHACTLASHDRRSKPRG